MVVIELLGVVFFIVFFMWVGGSGKGNFFMLGKLRWRKYFFIVRVIKGVVCFLEVSGKGGGCFCYCCFLWVVRNLG